MSCTLRFIGCGLLVAGLVGPLFAEPIQGPPDWADQNGSVYLAGKQAAPPDEQTVAEPPAAFEADPTIAALPTAPTAKVDSLVLPAVHEEPAPRPNEGDGRELAAPSPNRRVLRDAGHDESSRSESNRRRSQLDLGIPSGTAFTVLSSLAIVIGAFLIFAWLMRRGSQKLSTALPGEVVSVLGRVSLSARQFAHLLRVGNKLVLVTLSPSGAETITEITDPGEVDRLVGLCQEYSPHSTTKAFEQVFRQLSREPAPTGLFDTGSLPQSVSSAAAAYRAHRGETARV